MPMYCPKTAKVEYPIPPVLHPNPMVNEVMRRRYQYRWERVEFEARQIERGKWKEPVHTPFIPRDDFGNVIPRLDLRAPAREKSVPKPAPKYLNADISERDLYGASSLADRIVLY